MNKPIEAYEYLRSYLNAKQNSWDKQLLYKTYKKLAELSRDLHKYKLANFYGNKYLQLAQKVDDKIGEIEAITFLNQMTQLHLTKTNYVDPAQPSTSTQQQLPYIPDEKSPIEFYLETAERNTKFSNYTKAMENFWKALNIASKTGDKEKTAEIYELIAKTHISACDWEQAANYQLRYLNEIEINNDINRISSAYLGLIRIYSFMNKYDEALRCAGQYYALCTEASNWSGISVAENYIDEFREKLNMDKLDEDDSYLTYLIISSNSKKDNKSTDQNSDEMEEVAQNEWVERNTFAFKLFAEKNYIKSRNAHIDNASFALNNIKSIVYEGESCLHIGICSKELKHYSQALLHFTRSFCIATEISNKPLSIVSLYYIQDTYKKIAENSNKLHEGNKSDEELESLEMAEEIIKKRISLILPDEDIQNNCNVEWYNRIGQYNDAILVLKYMLERSEETQCHQFKIELYGDIGDNYKMLEKWLDAIRHYKIAYDLTNEFHIRPKRAEILFKMYETYREMNNFEEAVKHLQDYLYLCEQLFDSIGRRKCYEQFIDLYTKYRKYRLALMFADKLKRFCSQAGDCAGTKQACNIIVDIKTKCSTEGVADSNLICNRFGPVVRATDVIAKFFKEQEKNKTRSKCDTKTKVPELSNDP